MGSRYHGLISYMEHAIRDGVSPRDAIRNLVKDRLFGYMEKSPYRRAFVEEKYPEFLEDYDSVENMVLLLKG